MNKFENIWTLVDFDNVYLLFRFDDYCFIDFKSSIKLYLRHLLNLLVQT